MGRRPQLHPDLLERIVDDPLAGRWLNHPLVYEASVPEDAELIARVNERLETKRVNVAKARAQQDWRSYIDLHELGHRFPALASIRFDVPDGEFTELFGELWIEHDGALHAHRDFINWVLEDKRLAPEKLMTEGERAKLAELADVIEIYRGFSSDGTGNVERGPSWTRSKKQAKWFACRDPTLALGKKWPHLARGTVAKKHVTAYFARRDEEEIVVLPSKVAIETIDRLSHQWTVARMWEALGVTGPR